MAKAVKGAVKAFVTVWAVTTGAAFLLGTVGATGAFLFGINTATLATYAALTTLLQGATSNSIGGVGENFGTKTATRQPAAPRQIVYGQCRVGGTIVHMETSGTDNYLLHMVIAIAGHEIEELTNIRLNDKDLTTTTSTISGSTVYTVTNTEYTNTENDNNFGSGRLIRYTFQDGSQTAVDGFMNAQLSSMTTTDKFQGVAYVYMQMVFDAEAFGGGIPATSFLVKGKNVYDPRTNANATTDLQRSNPALIIRDYLTNTEYGLKAKSSEINDTTNAGGFASAANICDQNVTLADGSSTEKRYTANGFTNFSASGKDIIEGYLSAMAGKMSYVNGKFNVFAGASQTPSLTITDDDLLASVQVGTRPSTGGLYNTVKPVYVDASQNYVGTDAEVYQDTTMLNADTPSGESTANYVKTMEIQLPYTVTDTMAQRLARIALKSQRQTVSLSVLTSLQFMRLQPNDWVYLTNDRLSYSQKVFEVLATNVEAITEGETTVLGTRLELKEVASSVFDFATSDYTTGQSEGSDVGTGTYAVTAPTNLALAQQTNKDGVTTKVDIKATWTNNSSDKVTLTEVAYKLSTDGAYTSDFTVGKGVAVALLPNVVVGKTYNVKARHIDVNGVASAYTSAVNITISAPTDAPAVPTSLTASTGQAFNIVVSWINSSSADLKATKIYRRTSNTTPTDDTYLVDTIYGQNGKKTSTLFGTQDGLTAGTTYYFWARSVNHSDVHSAFTSVATGNFTNVDVGEIVDGAITTVKLATDAVTNAKIAVDAIQGDVIAAGAIVEAKLGVDAVTNAKIADNAVNTAQIVSSAISEAKIATGAITNTKLGTDAVTNAKLADNAVQTANLAANAITETKISDNAVTTGKIVANAITSTKISASAVVAGKIAANAVEAVAIAADAVTADKVAANAIVANNITSNAVTSDKIIANAITTAKINAGAVTADTIATNAVTAIKINANAITTDKIAANAITSAKIAANQITASEIAAGTITATQIATDTITASNIAAGAIATSELAANAVTAAKITAGTITATEIASNTISANEIASNTITASQIASGTITASEIASNTITGDRINVDTLDVKHFADVSADIINQTGGTVPLRVTAENSQWNGIYPGSTQNNTEAIYMNTTLNNVRNGAGFQVIYSAVLGDVRNGTIQYSFNGTSWTSLSPKMNANAGVFRTYVFVWQGTISGMSSSQETVYWRVNWNVSGAIFNSTYQAIYIDVDNTQ